MNKLFGIALFLAGLMLAVGTGANFRYFEADRDVSVAIVADDNELIDLTPVQPYAYLSNGKLTIKISPDNTNQYPGYGDGLSPDSLYVFEEMFNVSNELWENEESNYPICVTIQSENSHVTLFAGTYDSPIAGPGTSITFTVEHGNPVPIGMIFDMTGEGLGSDQGQLSISAQAGACD
ncbi:DUF1102 domain-containing protein [Pyrococcus furiosus DSM 3638]|uniref:DUF1102 domain-containing protein n=3 Tax=Pyrococcus furiosus TaxID=2261 RepID=Q8U3X6_PYRFU|nr:DUF1102 domain-containing protein [Pyrococcus furiosus]AAL80449.1 hypothetical protein PF0325 [Pyrococcus furiosus DSM 3638]AFN03114.1 hypothetical protein PFC_00705 [Pyrococcus furiosus COM1]QEK78041.1 DUF1102 domain-containing protein [Pyrococcus furiosus DSM 3638]